MRKEVTGNKNTTQRKPKEVVLFECTRKWASPWTDEAYFSVWW